MSSDNPFQPGAANPSDPYAPPSGVTQSIPKAEPPQPRKVAVKPIELINRSRRLIEGNYWLLLGVSVVGIFISQLVPFGIVTGAMMIGVFLCFLCQERRYAFDFNTLFKGFDQFGQSVIAVLLLLAFSMAILLPTIFLMFIAIAVAGSFGDTAMVLACVMLAAFTTAMSLLVYLPFMFVFQLMAEYRLESIPAIKLSWEGTKKNIVGIVGFMIVNFFISVILTLMCYIPVLLYTPIAFGTLLLLYRDIYGLPPGANTTGGSIQPTGSEPPPQSSVSY